MNAVPPVLRRAAAAALLAAAMAAGAQVRIDAPAGGWREAPATRAPFVQEVHYPASNVNPTGFPEAALIRGHLAAAPKAAAGARAPARLVVDGIAMPLSVDESGGFARPWSFGAGAHGVEVRPPGGGQPGRVQFHQVRGGDAGVRLRIVLSWDTDQTDLDLHVISPDGAHVFYGDRVAGNGGALDVDVTTGFGPEIYAAPRALPGLYHVYVNYYGAGDERDAITTAQVAIVEEEGRPGEKQQVFRVPLRKPGELTLVRSFRMP